MDNLKVKLVNQNRIWLCTESERLRTSSVNSGRIRISLNWNLEFETQRKLNYRFFKSIALKTIASWLVNGVPIQQVLSAREEIVTEVWIKLVFICFPYLTLLKGWCCSKVFLWPYRVYLRWSECRLVVCETSCSQNSRTDHRDACIICYNNILYEFHRRIHIG